MIRMALTGGIACGKSRVGVCLVQRDVPVCEADELTHAMLSGQGPVRDEVIREFGAAVVGLDGAIDRRGLGRIVFGDEERRRRLEAIVHPHVVRAWSAWLQERQNEGRRLVCVIVPLLFEGAFQDGWDAVVSVVSGRAIQIERMKGRGLTEEEACARMNAQWNVEEKMKRSDYVIVNDGDLSVLEAQLDKVLWRVQER